MTSTITNIAAAPAYAVFETAELLEQVLSYLPPSEVLLKSRVSRKWKSVVDGSPQFQRSLFLSSCGTEAVAPAYYLHISNKPEGSTAYHNLVNGASRPIYDISLELNPLAWWLGGGQGAAKLPNKVYPRQVLPPGLRKKKPQKDLLTTIRGLVCSFLCQSSKESSPKEELEPSWRRMYFTLQPITEVVLVVPTSVVTVNWGGDSVEVALRVPRGITLGSIKDEAEKALVELGIESLRTVRRKQK